MASASNSDLNQYSIVDFLLSNKFIGLRRREKPVSDQFIDFTTHLHVLVTAVAAVQEFSVHLHHSNLAPVVVLVGVVELQDLHVATLAARTALRREFVIYIGIWQPWGLYRTQ